MMKRREFMKLSAAVSFAVALPLASFGAQAVDVTITMTAPQIARAQAALGKARNLKDGAGNPRVATNAELKQYVVDQMRGLVLTQEKSDADAAAIAGEAAPSPFDPT